MPTIDQLAAATASSDTDELLVSQNGVARKITRAQVVAGLQQQIALASGSLLGRASSGTGAPETIAIGANLTLSNGTISANATPFSVSTLPSGSTPGASDLVPIGQAGTNAAVTYARFLSGLAGVAGVDGSQLSVTPTGASAPIKLGDFAAGALPTSGGQMLGPLGLAADPVQPTQAATKRYVDAQSATALPKAGGTLTGPLTLTSDPAQPLQPATKQYVDNQTSGLLPKAGGTLTGPLLLVADSVGPLQSATKQYVDGKASALLPLAGGTLSGGLSLAGDPSQPLNAATKRYVDAQAANALPTSGGTLTGPVLLAADPSQALQPATKQYVDGKASALLPLAGGTLSGSLSLAGDPSQPLNAATKRYVDAQAANALPTSGGTLTGPITLAADPSQALQAATKQYVDTRVQRSGDAMTGALTLAADPVQSLQAATKNYVDTATSANGVLNVRNAPFGAKLDGKTDDTGAFKAAYQAAAANSAIYVPAGVANILNPNAWGIPITKRVKWIVDGTTTPDGTALASGIPTGSAPGNYFLPGIVAGNSGVAAEFSQTGSQTTDFAVLHSSYVVNHTGGPTGGVVATNNRADTVIYNSPNNYIWGALDRLQWNGVQTPDPNNPAQHVSRYIQAIRATAGTDGSGNVLPQPQIWATCVQYIDQTGLPTSKTNAAQGMELDFHANGLDDMNGGDGGRYLASLALLQASTSGPPVEASNGLLVTLVSGHKGSFKRGVRVAAPFSQAALCTRWSQQLSGGHAIWLASGQHIAFSTDGTCYLTYDQTTNTIRSVRGSQSTPIGLGIALGWQTVITTSATLDPSTVGNIVFCVNTTPVIITLPPVAQVAAGTGWMFTNLGSADVSILPSTGQNIDNGPIVIHPNDRYYVVSDQWQGWKEVFRSNWFNPRFGGPLTLANYAVASLPTGQPAGAKAFAVNGRKPGEAAGAGTGVEVFFDGVRWISVCGGTQVLA